MSSLKELRNRLFSVRSTKKITTAMKLVAASRLRKAQTALEKNKTYQKLVEDAVKRILISYQKEEIEKKTKHILPKTLVEKQNPKTYLLVVFSSERGLCGSYNQNVAKVAANRFDELTKQGKNVKLIFYGKKAYNALKKNFGAHILEHEPSFASGGIFYREAVDMLEKIMRYYQEQNFDVCEIVHSRFQSALSRQIVSQRLYPIDVALNEHSDDMLDHVGDAYFDYKPSREELLEKAASKLLLGRVFEAMLNAEASEQGARMTAMDNATQNAQDMISDLTLKYNTLRQSAITTELSEIISGAEAL
ncbi:MAG: ATP synthase F1 subunit gamma [Alphaproteobacteria bacterium]|nr:ATP synthase F1 subunit gamma [Alphaproteobacteria bacterium]